MSPASSDTTGWKAATISPLLMAASSGAARRAGVVSRRHGRLDPLARSPRRAAARARGSGRRDRRGAAASAVRADAHTGSAAQHHVALGTSDRLPCNVEEPFHGEPIAPAGREQRKKVRSADSFDDAVLATGESQPMMKLGDREVAGAAAEVGIDGLQPDDADRDAQQIAIEPAALIGDEIPADDARCVVLERARRATERTPAARCFLRPPAAVAAAAWRSPDGLAATIGLRRHDCACVSSSTWSSTSRVISVHRSTVAGRPNDGPNVTK